MEKKNISDIPELYRPRLEMIEGLIKNSSTSELEEVARDMRNNGCKINLNESVMESMFLGAGYSEQEVDKYVFDKILDELKMRKLIGD